MIDSQLYGTNDPFEYDADEIIEAAACDSDVPLDLWNKTTSKVTRFRPQRKVYQIYLN